MLNFEYYCFSLVDLEELIKYTIESNLSSGKVHIPVLFISPELIPTDRIEANFKVAVSKQNC